MRQYLNFISHIGLNKAIKEKIKYKGYYWKKNAIKNL
mgnify:CR=1 FL=1